MLLGIKLSVSANSSGSPQATEHGRSVLRDAGRPVFRHVPSDIGVIIVTGPVRPV